MAHQIELGVDGLGPRLVEEFFFLFYKSSHPNHGRRLEVKWSSIYYF